MLIIFFHNFLQKTLQEFFQSPPEISLWILSEFLNRSHQVLLEEFVQFFSSKKKPVGDSLMRFFRVFSQKSARGFDRGFCKSSSRDFSVNAFEISKQISLESDISLEIYPDFLQTKTSSNTLIRFFRVFSYKNLPGVVPENPARDLHRFLHDFFSEVLNRSHHTFL